MAESLVFVLVCIDIGDDPSNDAKDCVGGGGLREFSVIGGADVVLDCIGVADVVDDVTDRVD